MKVSELKKGMLLECIDKNYTFTINPLYSFSRDQPSIKWLDIRKKRNKYSRNESPKIDFVTYLGTKKDTGIDMSWCDKFALANGEVVAVEPHAWRKLRCAE